MKRMKKILCTISVFIGCMGISILPTILFRAKNLYFFFRQPDYWIITVFLATAATYGLVQEMDDKTK